MKKRFIRLGVLSLVLVGTSFVPALGASATTRMATNVRVSVTLPNALASNLPLLRLHFSAPTKASALPELVTHPALSTTWQQISPEDVQAVSLSPLTPSANYTFSTPTLMSCLKSCTFSAVSPQQASVATNLTWEAQLLAQLHYLPLTFIPGTPQQTPTQQVNGSFDWTYHLPVDLTSLWSVGTNNIVLQGALKTFQSQLNLPVTGVINAATWNDLVNAVNADRVDPTTYDYVDVTEQLPETLDLYVAGKLIFHSLVNTGISVAPTEEGTYAVYARFLSTTMSGTNPDGTKYDDPDIPWVSYFNGGDALHGFIRSTYGWPQSLGCVEMPFDSAQTVFPYTPIGTLVTVHD